LINGAFLNSERRIRNGWWILVFLLVLTSMLVPVILFAQKNSMDVSMNTQAIIIFLTALVCQMLRRQPLTELLGKFNRTWLKEFVMGGLMGSALMLVPAFLLQTFGWVDLQWNSVGVSNLTSSLFLFAGVALAEELLFRGFVFQRLISGLGPGPARVLIAIFFLLTHLNNPGMSGGIKVMASINFFLASILFGLAFLRTRNLVMPFGLHWMANWMQGGVLGFGVSGTETAGLWTPVFAEAPVWFTGGQFGIEASLPGLICVVLMLIAVYRMNSAKPMTNE
jgi:membrane protease YdiL (CAAX protease family)